jgi:hypothetical protein
MTDPTTPKPPAATDLPDLVGDILDWDGNPVEPTTPPDGLYDD